MAHGFPDWATSGYARYAFPDLDISELPARLGYPTVFDRRGKVFYLTTFEYGKGMWSLGSYGSGAELGLTREKYQFGGYALYIKSATGLGNYARTCNFFPYPALCPFGCEMYIAFDGDLEQVLGRLIINDGMDVQSYYWWYSPANNELGIHCGEAGDVVLEDDLSMRSANYQFHVFKWVVNPLVKKWVRLIVDNRTYDLKDYHADVSPYGEITYIEPILQIRGPTDTSLYAYLDYVILTFDEP